MDILIRVIILGSLSVILLPLIQLLFDNINKKKQENLKRYGKVIEVIINNFKQEGILNHIIIVIRIVAESFIYGKRYKFISEKKYPEKSDNFKIGDHVNVLVNQDNPKQYYFDPNDLN